MPISIINDSNFATAGIYIEGSRNGGTGVVGNLEFYNRLNGGVTSNLRVNGDGNFHFNKRVGINSTAPSSYLDVRGDINFQNNALITSMDSNGVGGSNIDHIWHSDSPNYGKGGTWNFVSDTTYKAAGNSAIQIGYLANSGGGHLLGNVGIGLTSPAVDLHVQSASTVVRFESTDDATSARLEILAVSYTHLTLPTN